MKGAVELYIYIYVYIYVYESSTVKERRSKTLKNGDWV